MTTTQTGGATSRSAPSETMAADQWYFQKLGEEFGPLSFDELVDMSRTGTVLPSDPVRKGDVGPWQRADSLAGMFAKAKAQIEKAESKWVVEVFGENLGPLGIGEVAEMLKQHQLLPTDRIRPADGENWQSVGKLLDALSRGKSQSAASPESKSQPADKEPKNGTSLTPAAAANPEDLEQLILDLFAEPIPKSSGNDSGSSNFNAEDEPSLDEETGNPVIEAEEIPRSRRIKRIALEPRRPIKVPWLELFLVICGIALLFQMFPAAFWWLVSWVDLKSWMWRGVATLTGVGLVVAYYFLKNRWEDD